MEKHSKNNIRLGVFVISATVLFILAMYFIGDKQNLFGANIELKAEFNNVNGLRRGSNVRLAGIDIGTVKTVTIVSDTAVIVTMDVSDDAKEFVKVDAVAVIGTDGLMGNKIISISPGSPGSPSVQEGDMLHTFDILATDDIFRKLSETNENVAVVAENLATAIQEINRGEGTLGMLIKDPKMAEDLQQSLANVRKMSEQAKSISGTLERSLNKLNLEERVEGSLLMDSTFANDLRATVVNLKTAGENAAFLTSDLRVLVERLNSTEGTAGRIIGDTAISHSLEQSLIEIQQAASGFNENMEALKHSFLFKRYFKKLEKQEKDIP